MKKKNILILDTETAGSLAYPFVYDIGFIVYDIHNKKTLCKKSIILQEVFSNKELMHTAYYMEKLPQYRKDLQKGIHELKTIEKAFDCLSDIIKLYNIQEVYTYTFFDSRAIKNMIEFYSLDFDINSLQFFDIRAYAIKTLFNDNYKNFCKVNNFITKKGSYQTTAETMGRYIMNNPSYIESHTALKDCELELDILISTINKGLKFGEKLASVNNSNLKVEK